MVLRFLGAGGAATGAEDGTAGSAAAEISSALRFLGALVVVVELAFLGPVLRFFAAGAGGGSAAAGTKEAAGGGSEAAISLALRFGAPVLVFLTAGAPGAGGGGSAAEISLALRLMLVFLAAGALGAGGGASETTTWAALRLAPRPRRGGAGGAAAGLLDEGFLLGFLMGVQSTIFGPEGVYSTVWLRRPGGVACERIVFVFVFMTRTRALPGTNVAHLVMEKGGSPCPTGYGLRGSNRTQSGDGG